MRKLGIVAVGTWRPPSPHRAHRERRSATTSTGEEHLSVSAGDRFGRRLREVPIDRRADGDRCLIEGQVPATRAHPPALPRHDSVDGVDESTDEVDVRRCRFH